MDGPLDLSLVWGVSSSCLKVIRAVHFADLTALFILDDSLALNKVGISQPHLTAGRQPEEAFRGVLEKIIPLDVKHAPEGNLARPHTRVLRVIRGCEFLGLP